MSEKIRPFPPLPAHVTWAGLHLPLRGYRCGLAHFHLLIQPRSDSGPGPFSDGAFARCPSAVRHQTGGCQELTECWGWQAKGRDRVADSVRIRKPAAKGAK